MSEKPQRMQALRRHIAALASLKESDSPLISAYFDTTEAPESMRLLFGIWASSVRSSFCRGHQQLFDDAKAKVLETLDNGWPPGTRSFAVFVRAGETPLTLAIPLGARIDPSFHAGELPVIFPLIQAKDRFNRYVIAICTEESARILEVSLGAVSEELLAKSPELRERLGREWTREHYHHQKRERHRRFVREKVDIIADLMSRRGHNHLLLAGHPRYVSRLREALPKHLAARVVGEIPKSPNGQDDSSIIEESLDAFIAAEYDESVANVERLHQEIRRGGLGVVGIEASLRALRDGSADMLVVSENLADEDREAMVRLATLHDISIEVCEDDPLIDDYGGVGCLLRFRQDFVSQVLEEMA
ncbi:MAG: host attachment protein [Verrucomicrobiota bacterium]